MSESLVAKRYANALLELGAETGTLDRIVEDFDQLAAAYRASAELRNVVENPLVALAAKKAAAREIADQIGVTEMSRNALLLLIDRRRMRTLTHIARYLRQASDARSGLVRALVTTATPLSEDYYQKLQRQLEALTGKRVILERKEDPSLIAGVVTKIGDRVFDGSVRTRLVAMKEALLPT